MNNTINIKDLETTMVIDDSDYFLIEKQSGTKKILSKSLLEKDLVFKDLKWLNIGDSLSAYSGNEFGYSNPTTWANEASLLTGATIKNCAKAGAGLGHIDTLMSMTSTTTDDIVNADIITIMLYGNDLLDGLPIGTHADEPNQNGETCCARLKSLINYIQQYNKTAPIVFIQEPMRLDSFGINSWEYADGFKRLCRFMQIPYLDIASYCGFNSNNYDVYYHTDKLHLKPEGYKRVAYLIANKIKEYIKA